MKKILFKKYSGAGNDFVLIDEKDNNSFFLSEKILKKMCDRRRGIGADGVLLISESKKYDFELRYYNSDGKLGSLCGNGSRCALKYVFNKISNFSNNLVFECEDKIYTGKINTNNNITFFMQPPFDYRNKLEMEIDNQGISKQKVFFDFINTGSPHVVLNIDELQDEIKKNIGNNLHKLNVVEFGKQIRNNTNLFPEGTNVNFVQVKNDKVFIRTFERGVEDETLACGTGSVASAIILTLNKIISPPVELYTFGGDVLIVDFDIENKNIKNVSLTGQAIEIFTGEYLINEN